MAHWTEDSPEYLEATRAAYDALDAASARMRAAQTANDRAAYDLAAADYRKAQDMLHAAEVAHDSRYQ